MKINSTLEKKLLKYSAMAGGVIAMGVNADAQIVYFDENPDVTFTGHQQGATFDFDGDTNDDMSVATLDSTATGTYMSTPYNLTYQAVPVIPGSGAAFLSVSTGYPNALNLNDPINSAGSFASSQGSAAFVLGGTFGGNPVNVQSGPWLGATDMYLGFRFTTGGNLHYGWMRMDVDATATNVTIKDWAYNSTPDAAINAGQMAVGVNVLDQELALVRFTNNQVEIKTIAGSNGNLTIVSTEGKVVYNAAMNSTTETVDLSNFAAGLYIVNAQFNEGAVSHKVVVR